MEHQLTAPQDRSTEPYPHYRARSLQDAALDQGESAYADVDEYPSDLLEAILADARHFADATNLNFETVSKAAIRLYENDKATESRNEKPQRVATETDTDRADDRWYRKYLRECGAATFEGDPVIKKLRDFVTAMEELSEAWPTSDGNHPIITGGGYPFGESFDDLLCKVQQWRDAVETRAHWAFYRQTTVPCPACDFRRANEPGEKYSTTDAKGNCQNCDYPVISDPCISQVNDGVINETHDFQPNGSAQTCTECGLDVPYTQADALRVFPVGTRVRLAVDIDRFDHFIAKAGMTGVVTEHEEDHLYVTMDQHLDGAEEWDNQICWQDYSQECGNIFAELEVIPIDSDLQGVKNLLESISLANTPYNDYEMDRLDAIETLARRLG